jgi:glycosyltransferase involved in cell wall biosynthesis
VELSVVIPCRDDPRLGDCVGSIESDVETIVVLNGSTEAFTTDVRRAVGERARIERLPRANATRAMEHGIAVARHDHILLMDSDCTFEPGSLTAIATAFEKGDPAGEVYKGRIVFDRDRRRMSQLVARSRQQRMSGVVNAYKPPLAFSRGLAARIGGYFFDARLRWKEDAELSHRIRVAGVQVVPVNGCVIHHAPLSWATDLGSTFNYGEGAALARHLDMPLTRPARSVRAALRADGLEAAAYMALGNHVRAVGYAYATGRLRLSRGRWLEQVAGE